MTSSANALPDAAGNTPSSPARLSLGAIFLRILLLVFVAGFALTVAVVWSVWPRGDTRALRHTVMAAMPERWNQHFEFRVGGVLCDLAQTAAWFTPMPEEAKEALGAIKSVEVSLAQLSVPATPGQRAAAFAAARAEMIGRGWEPTVQVLDGRDLVAVFTRPAGILGGRMRICALVLDGQQLVIANAEIDPTPLAAVAQKAIADARKHTL
jgi:hypothetical protein